MLLALSAVERRECLPRVAYALDSLRADSREKQRQPLRVSPLEASASLSSIVGGRDVGWFLKLKGSW